MKPFAYGNGTSGGVYHVDCWYKHADEVFHGQRVRAFLGTIYYRGAEQRELKGVRCAGCNQLFANSIKADAPDCVY